MRSEHQVVAAAKAFGQAPSNTSGAKMIAFVPPHNPKKRSTLTSDSRKAQRKPLRDHGHFNWITWNFCRLDEPSIFVGRHSVALLALI
jgi:hypothetical protein